MTRFILYWLAAANGIGFGLMVADKRRAEAGLRRFRESTLLGWAFFGGAIGTFAASRLARHKTRKQPFATQMIVYLLIELILLALWALGFVEPQIASLLAILRSPA